MDCLELGRKSTLRGLWKQRRVFLEEEDREWGRGQGDRSRVSENLYLII